MSRPVSQRSETTQITTQRSLVEESARFVGSCGDSATATQHHFLPAFCNRADGRVELAKLPNGQNAPMHLICALPEAWASKCDSDGTVVELIDGIVAGFVRNGHFYTREEAAELR